MSENSSTASAPVRRINLDWVPAVYFTPRQAFKLISAEGRRTWLTPLLFMSLTALFLVVVSGPTRLAAAQSGISLPTDFQNFPPEVQAQTMQSAQATQGPLFIYIFPAVLALGQVWAGWLIMGGLLHLVLTLFGGRSSTGSAMNLVAWSALPFALRDLVRGVAVLSTHTLIANPGLSGFALTGGRAALFLGKLLGTVDIYLFWHILLLVLGLRLGIGLSRGKTWAAVLITLGIGIGLQAGLGFVASLAGGLSVSGPFFF